MGSYCHTELDVASSFLILTFWIPGQARGACELI